MDTQTKLELLADAGKYDLACACGRDQEDSRKRNAAGNAWLYPLTLPSGGRGVMLKTLLSSSCINNCAYCPLQSGLDSIRRCTLGAQELAQTFLDYDRRKRLLGLFLSSGVLRSPDHTMTRLIAVAAILRRKYRYKGYIHLKIIPGASDAAIEEAVSLASAVSLNIETPSAQHCRSLSPDKDWERDIMRPIQLIQRLIAENKSKTKRRVRQTTQFIVGASTETDSEIIKKTFSLYRDNNMERVYFSAYQSKAGNLPGTGDDLMREHSLYQSDFLIRKYGFTENDLLYDQNGKLSLTSDPKKCWADAHPDFFPVKIKTADRWQLLRVPGVGPVTVTRIIKFRKETCIRNVSDVGLKGKRAALAAQYLDFS